MTRLYIAEKPSLARAIAAGLPMPQKRDGDCIRCGENDVVAWCVGHIMELANPDEYGEQYKKWSLETLPIVPDRWKYNITNKKLFNNIKKLIGEASEIVHCGDPDREGQILVDEVIQHVGSKLPVKRLLVNDMNLPAVKKSLASMKDNKDFKTLSDGALARSQADWLYGMNMTRLYTLLGQKGGYDGVLSVGGVQTPLLGLIVRRDLEIEGFVSKPYYKISAKIQAENGYFVANWKPGEASESYCDEDGRLLNKDHADTVVKRINGTSGVITSLDKKTKKQNAPLPFSLSALQILASKRLNLDADKTLNIVQSLYETHKLTTYPRSDCGYLPEGHLAEVSGVVEAIKANAELDSIVKGADFSLKSPAWNDKKITAHHAIIPTPNASGSTKLSDIEKTIYEMICERYLMQFYPAYTFEQTKVSAVSGEDLFTASGRVTIVEGWRCLVKKGDEEDSKQEEEGDTKFPPLTVGESVDFTEVTSTEKTTKPPKHFTAATLLAAMTGISRFVTNPDLKKILKETDGIGTEATRANIIKTIFDRNYVVKKGKNIISTEVGRSMIAVLPEDSTTPDMRAYWETSMKSIVEGEEQLYSFMDGIKQKISSLVDSGKALGKLGVVDGENLPKCPKCETGNLKKRKGSKGVFWGCSAYPECKNTVPDKAGKPDFKSQETVPCPSCKSAMKRIKGKYGFFWPCQTCKINYKDKRGKPDIAPKNVNDVTDFDCGDCGKKLIRRVSVKGKGDQKKSTTWYGCSGFPGCKKTYFDRNGEPKYEAVSE